MKKILIAGGTGLIGSHLINRLKDKYEVHILSRSKKNNEGSVIYHVWDIDKNYIDVEALKVDVIINLTGAGIAEKRWDMDRKKLLIDSRVKPLALIEKTLLENKLKPSLFIGASAIGFYGDRQDESLDENSKIGSGFLSDCSKVWEEASNKITPLVDRSIILRIGVVLSTKGGALPELMKTSPVGFLNYFGSGDMIYSWIHIDDLVSIITSSIENEKYSGILNAVSPTPLSNKEFTKSLGNALGNRLVFSAPIFALKLILGEMSAVVLYSSKVLPKRLVELNHKFQFQNITEAFKDLLLRKI
jgi:uncharacterized protein